MESSDVNKKLLNTEYVYCLSNKSFSPDVLKVGWTRNNPAYRANQLYTTGLPTPFKIEFLILTYQGRALEGRIHEYLTRFRISGSREFFNIPLSELRDILINKFSLKLVQLSDIIDQLPEIDKIHKHKKRQESFVPITNSYSESEPPLIDQEELENMFSQFRYQPSPPNSPPEATNLFDKFRYRPTSR